MTRGDRHHGDLIPAPKGKRRFAYQDETVWPGAYFNSFPPERGDPRECELYSKYELIIYKHTDKALLVELKKHRRDVVQQRKRRGKAVITEVFYTVLSFAELVNRLLGPGCSVSYEEEAFPDSVAEAMKKAYPK